MNIHEHQAKQILKKYGAVVPEGVFALNVDELIQKAKALKTEKYVLKAQIHAGGRGKAGGVKILNSIEELTVAAKELLGKTLVTHQTGPEGREVKRLYVEESSNIDKEFYLSCLVDRATSKIAFISSNQGGMDIEEVAAKSPSQILTTKVELNEEISNKDCEFGYRTSVFKNRTLSSFLSNFVIISVDFSLSLDWKNLNTPDYASIKSILPSNPNGLDIANAVLNLRGKKLPDFNIFPNVGSFFINPVVDNTKAEKLRKEFVNIPIITLNGSFKLSAAWLIDSLGLKGESVGGISISRQHALVLVNHSAGTFDRAGQQDRRWRASSGQSRAACAPRRRRAPASTADRTGR